MSTSGGRPGIGEPAGPLAEAALALFVLLCLAAFAQARPEPWAWLILLPGLVASTTRLVRFPPPLQLAVERATWFALVLVAAVVLNWVVSPLGQGQPAPPLPAAVGYALALLACLFLAGRALWPPARTTVPAALGTVVVAASQAGAPMRASIAVAAVAAAGLLVASNVRVRAGSVAAQVIRTVLFGAAAAGVAWSIAWFLPWAQPKVVQAAAKAAFPEAESGFSLETRLGDVGELKLSPRRVMRVWTDRPHKLRGAVATVFDGRAWRAVAGPPPQPLALVAAPEEAAVAVFEDVPGESYRVPGRSTTGATIVTRILQVAPLQGALVAPSGVIVVRTALNRILIDASGVLGPPVSAGETYAIVSGIAPEAGPEPGLEMLNVPADTDPRVRELAARLSEGAPDPEHRLAHTLTFLQTEYRYALRVGPFHTRQPVAEFLFEKKAGWCQYFASAAALLLRLEGVPTRLVTGFQLRPSLHRGGHYVVREADAHAWIEAWLPGQGWVEADPTPLGGYEAAHGGLDDGWWADAEERLKGLLARLWGAEWRAIPGIVWAELKAALRSRTGRWLGVLLLGVMLLALGRAAWRRRPSRRGSSPPTDAAPELKHLLAGLDRAWARHGAPRPASQAPLEHLLAMPAQRLPATLREASRRAVDGYYRARFSGAPLTPDALRALEEGLTRAEEGAYS